jgi:acetyl esterase/lipase
MRRTAPCLTAAAVLVLLGVGHAPAQTVNLWPGVAPGSEEWSWQEVVTRDTPLGTVVTDVVTPTLTIYLPEGSKATGTGLVVAPGGYCVALAVDREGGDVARWLRDRGIAAFVLKYRLQRKLQPGVPKDLDMDQACRYGIADGIRAIRVVREHAADWGVSPDRVGIMGFSAGGMVASGALLQADAAARPSFAALIYGAPFGTMPPIPTGLPPIFMAWAQDDDVAGEAVDGFYEKLRAAGNEPEAHVFSAGGHGFGVREQGTSSDHWTAEFEWWLQAHGLVPAHAPE